MRTLTLAILLLVPAVQADAGDPVQSLPGACRDECFPPPVAPVALPDDCTLDPDNGIGCADPTPCGIVQQPTCWTLRFVCYWAEYPLNGTTGLSCQTQPGANVTDPEGGNCNNYGVRVVVVVGSSVCEGEACGNTGVLVVVGRWCGEGTRVCLAAECADPCAVNLAAIGSAATLALPDLEALVGAPTWGAAFVGTPTSGPVVIYVADPCP